MSGNVTGPTRELIYLCLTQWRLGLELYKTCLVWRLSNRASMWERNYFRNEAATHPPCENLALGTPVRVRSTSVVPDPDRVRHAYYQGRS